MQNQYVNIIAWKANVANSMGEFVAEQIKTAKQIDILTGYFFFDGFQAINDALKENEEVTIRILVGMDAGTDTRGLLHEIYEYEKDNTPKEASELYIRQLKEVLSNWPPERITESQSAAWKQYAQMIHEGRLQIRSTCEPNHAKIYIFHDKHDNVSYTGGSSNFSYSGLQGRREFNVHVSTENADIVCKLFDESWKNAIPITEADLKEPSATSEIEKVLKTETPDSTVEPFDAYMKVLCEYMDLQRTDDKLNSRIRKIIREAQFPDGERIEEQDYQIDAIQRAQNILNVHGGVILADVVGLGKSIVASVLASLSDAPGIIIAPSALCGDGNWKTYLSTFHLEQDGWECHSYGMIGAIPKDVIQKARTIIIDEAHNIRNRKTETYKKLQKICIGKKIIFLSATPFNNKPDDIYALISLISNSMIAGFSKTELETMFMDFSKQYEAINKDSDVRKRKNATKTLSEKIRKIVSRITVRRNRLDLIHEDSPYREEMLPKISKLAHPRNEEYILSDNVRIFYEQILKKYFAGANKAFKGFMYIPELSNGGKSDTEDQLFSMICHFIVTRWESSPVAFKKTVQNIKNSLDISIKLFESKGIFIRLSPDLREDDWSDDKDFFETYEKEWNKAFLNYKHTIYVRSVEDKQKLLKQFPRIDKTRITVLSKPDDFLSGLRRDFKVLQGILDDYNNMELDNPGKDAKFQCLVENIRDVLNGNLDKGTDDEGKQRKIIVFSGFADTAEYVAKNLEHYFPNTVICVSGENINKELTQEDAINFGFSLEEYKEHKTKVSQKKALTRRDAVIRNFKFSALQKNNSSEQKKILVCTDVLSEGIDLNAAGIVFNYDMAYNPVRIIQRLGRINRISYKVFETLYRVNFFPTVKGENINNVKKISTRKAHIIQELFAEDASILTAEETVKPAGSIFASSGIEDDSANGPMSEDLQIRGMYNKALGLKCGTSEDKRSKYLDKIKKLSGRFCKFHGKEETLFFFFKNSVTVSAIELPQFASKNDADTISVPLVEALKKIQCEPNCVSIPFKQSEEGCVWKAFSTWNQKKFLVSSIKQNTKKFKQAYEIIRNMDLGTLKGEIMAFLNINPDFANAVIAQEHSAQHVHLLFKTYNIQQVHEAMECFMTTGILV